MRNIWTIAKREYDNYYNNPLAYAIAVAILFPLGIIFAFIMLNGAQSQAFGGGAAPTTDILTQWYIYLLIFFTPGLTMRLVSDEARMGTLELMLTAPLRDSEFIIGKWLGGFMFVSTITLVTLLYPIVLNNFIQPGLDLGLVLSSYIGVILVTAAFIGLGTGVSAIFENQFVAFFITFALLLILWIFIGVPSYFIQNGGVFDYLSLGKHFFETMNVGKINLGDITYFLSLTALGLFTGTTAIEIRRWK